MKTRVITAVALLPLLLLVVLAAPKIFTAILFAAMAAIAAVIKLLSVPVKISSAKSLPRLIHIHIICLDKLLDDIDLTIRQIASALKNRTAILPYKKLC